MGDDTEEGQQLERIRVPVSELLVRKLRALDSALAATIARVAGGKGEALDAEAIHDMRVAVRRIRTTLKLARPVFGRHWVDFVRAAFTLLHRSSGQLRDEEVLGETLDTLEGAPRNLRAWRERRRARERSLRRQMVASIRGGAVDHARHLLDALLSLPVKPSRDAERTKFARKVMARAEQRVLDGQGVDTGDVVGLHRLRIAYKELRYAAETLNEALPPELANLEKPAASFQKRLGEIHDVDMALLSVTRARGLDPRTRAASLAALRRARAEKVARYLRALAPAAPKADATPSARGAQPAEDGSVAQ